MRIPHIINRNTLIVYTPSNVTLKLLYEQNRKLRSESFFRDEIIPASLASLCVMVICKNFEKYPIINELVMCADRDFLLEILKTDLPLQLVVPIIDDEIYWMRRYADKYGVASQHRHPGWTWKCIYLENHMQSLIENAQPELNDEEDMEEITTLLNKYVYRLVIDQLQQWKPPLTLDPEEIPETFPCEHINLEPIFRRLQSVEQLVIKYGMSNVGQSFSWNMFEISIEDAKHLGAALLNLKKLRLFDLHASKFEDRHLQILIKDLIKIQTLEELSLKNCSIGDQGALCIAKLMLSHQTLRRIVLGNNKIGARGGLGIGYALTQPECCPLKHLDLRLNPLGHEGVMGLFRALIRFQTVEELIISGCGFGDETCTRLATLIQLNYQLKLIDISNNWCKPGEQDLYNAVMTNPTLQWLDLRETNIEEPYYSKILKKLHRNRNREDSLYSTEEIEEEEEEEVIPEEVKVEAVPEEEEVEEVEEVNPYQYLLD